MKYNIIIDVFIFILFLSCNLMLSSKLILYNPDFENNLIKFGNIK